MKSSQTKAPTMQKSGKVKKSIRLTALLVVLAVMGSMLLIGCQGTDPSSEETFASHVKEIQTGTQQSNGRTITNYQVILNESSDWTGMDDEARKAITDEAIMECKGRASAAGTNEYNIIGSKENGETVFLYDRSVEQVLIYENGVSTGNTIPAPTN